MRAPGKEAVKGQRVQEADVSTAKRRTRTDAARASTASAHLGATVTTRRGNKTRKPRWPVSYLRVLPPQFRSEDN